MKHPTEQTETMEDSTDISRLVLYQTLYYLLGVFYSKFSKVEEEKRKSLLQVSVIIQNSKSKVVILMCLAILLSKHHA